MNSAFVDHFFTLNETEYDLSMPLQRAKYIIDILSPLIIFSISHDDMLVIYDSNRTRLRNGMYEYYMQFKIYPQFKQYLKDKENFCNRVIESFYPVKKHDGRTYQDYEEVKSFQEVKPFLQEYYGITKDPRQLLSMRQVGSSVTYTKERWIEFISRKSHCMMGSYDYDKLSKWIVGLSVQPPLTDIWKYLVGLKYYNLV